MHFSSFDLTMYFDMGYIYLFYLTCSNDHSEMYSDLFKGDFERLIWLKKMELELEIHTIVSSC